MSKETNSIRDIGGIQIGTASAGIKYSDREDLLVFEIGKNSESAAVFTQNSFCAAPVTLAKNNIAASPTRALVINSGNANAGTGQEGIESAEKICDSVASCLNLPAKSVLPFSTGVIGEPLPVSKIISAIPQACTFSRKQDWHAAAEAIMTTDTRPKLTSRTFFVNSKEYAITGIAKGAGMIHPNMATMLAFVATDLGVGKQLLQSSLNLVTERSFNRISIDGDTSTNDACVLVATGCAGGVVLEDRADSGYEEFYAALEELFVDLAQAIVRDGEGATKFISIAVNGGASDDECKKVAFTIAHSPLVKTAFFASDPNWGRILAAVGRSGLENLDVTRVQIYLDNLCIVSDGARNPDYMEAKGEKVMAQPEIRITISLGRGIAATEIWTSDLSHEYVRINAEYRT